MVRVLNELGSEVQEAEFGKQFSEEIGWLILAGDNSMKRDCGQDR